MLIGNKKFKIRMFNWSMETMKYSYAHVQHAEYELLSLFDNLLNNWILKIKTKNRS